MQRNLFKVTANRRHCKTSKHIFVLLRGDVIALVTFKGAEINDFSLFDEKSKPKIWRYKLKSVTLHPLIKQSEKVIHCDCKTTSIAFPLLERWQSGRMHRSWKPAYWEVPGVRIPLSPQCSDAFKWLLFTASTAISNTLWRDGRVVECTGLENRRTERYRGFESLSLRQRVL